MGSCREGGGSMVQYVWWETGMRKVEGEYGVCRGRGGMGVLVGEGF